MIKGRNDVILDRYIIKQVFERSAIVYHVCDREKDSQHFIAKRLRPQHARERPLLDWFIREARIWQQLTMMNKSHPHLVKLVEPMRLDTEGDELVSYFFIEYIPGNNLGKIIESTTRNRLCYPQTLWWAVQIASAMEYVSTPEKNGYGVFIHRDLDSSNIMITEKGDAKVNDWGIGRNLSEPDPQIPLRSLHDFKDGAAGKPTCMPPEQFPPGRAEKYGVPGDVYYLGGLIFEMLTGKQVNPKDDCMRLRVHAQSEDEVRRCLQKYQQNFALKMLRNTSPSQKLADLVENCIKVDTQQRIGNFTLVLNQLLELSKEVQLGQNEKNFVACRHCSFITEESQAHCPVCRQQNQFAPWDPSTFKFDIKRSEPPPPPEQINKLIRIPAGAAILGVNDESLYQIIKVISEHKKNAEHWLLQNPKTVNLPEFFIAKQAVSNEEYREFVEATKWREPEYWQEKNTGGKAQPDGKLPVVNVNFMDAEAFCQWKDSRLPTNDEWERAMRGTDGRTYPWGNEWKGVLTCNTLERHKAVKEELVAVTEFSNYASPDGTLNMTGNVWEWVDGGEEGRKHLRGGSWQYLGELYSVAWFRMPTDPDLTKEDIGFRYAQDGAKSYSPPSLKDLKAVVSIPSGAYRIGIAPTQIGSLIRKHKISAVEAHALSRSRSRSIRINSFQLRKYLVTNEEYFQFIQRTNYQRSPEHWLQQLLRWSDRPFLEKYRYHPVTNVNYEDATAFCAWCGGRLPSNEEWECAARGEAGLLFPWGNDLEPERCNVSESGLARTSRVDENVSDASPAGCFDMTGNVLEWVAEDNDGYYFVRGGSYNYNGVPYGVAAYCMPADPEVKAPNLGFRCVL